MKLDWLCEEKLTAVSLGCAGLMLADGGLISGGVIAGAGLLGMWNKARRADGVNSEKLLAEVRKQVRADFERWAAGESLSEADLRAADKAMAEHLHECVPPVDDLAKTTFHSEDFPAFAALLVVDRLAQRNPIFSIDHPARSPVARDFALVVVKGALTKAKEQAPFMQRLTQEVVLLLPQHLVRLEGKVDGIAQGQAEQMALLNQIVASLQPAATAQGVNAEKLIALASQIVAKVDDVDEAERALAAAIEELLKLREEARRGTNFGDEVDEAIRRIFAKVEANDFAGAQKQGDEEYRRLSEQAEQLQAARESVVETNLSVARMAYDAERMAHWALERRRLAEGVEQLSLEQIQQETNDWNASADSSGVLLDMDVAVALGHHAFNKASTAEERACCLSDLGIALNTKGWWIGGHDGLALCGEAVVTYRAALEQITCAETPEQWAITQNNLGNALLNQGELIGGSDATKLLSEAVVAFRRALQVRTRAEFPMDWAITQINLGNALFAQRSKVSDQKLGTLLDKVVAAYRAGLEVFTRANGPTEWGTALNNLGNALRVQGAHSGSTTLLQEAVTVLHEALGERDRTAKPLAWAMTQGNIGLAEEDLGDSTSGYRQLSHWSAAETAFLLALEVFNQENTTSYHNTATRSLTRVRAKLASLT